MGWRDRVRYEPNERGLARKVFVKHEARILPRLRIENKYGQAVDRYARRAVVLRTPLLLKGEGACLTASGTTIDSPFRICFTIAQHSARRCFSTKSAYLDALAWFRGESRTQESTIDIDEKLTHEFRTILKQTQFYFYFVFRVWNSFHQHVQQQTE